MNSIPADGRFVRDGEMEGLEWRGGDKGGNIESSRVIYARILIWIVSNAEEEGVRGSRGSRRRLRSD